MSRRGVICGGSIVVDVNKVIDRLPPPEELAVILPQTTERCLVQGVCVAAVSLTSPSPSAGIRPLAECLAYGDHHGFGSA